MRLLLQELKKLFRPRYGAIAIALLILLCGFFTASNFYYRYQDAHQVQPQPNAPEAVIYDSYDLLFTDMLLAEYGDTIELEEVSRFQAQTERFCDQARAAVQADTHIQEAHMVLNDSYQLLPDFDFYTDIGETGIFIDDPYLWACTLGTIQLPGTDYPLGFAEKMLPLLAGLEAAAATASAEDSVLYHVTSPLFIREMGNALMPVLFASLCSILLLVPYGILENRSHTMPLLCATRTGRRLEGRRIAAAFGCVLCFVAIGAALAVSQFAAWDLNAYYPTTVDDGILEANGFLLSAPTTAGPMGTAPVVYGGSTFLGLFVQLFLFAVISGIVCPMLAVFAAFYLRNIITAFTAALPAVLLAIGLFFTYVVRPVGGSGFFASGKLHFSFQGEPWAVLAGLTLLLIAAAAAHLIHTKRCEIL